MFDLCVRFACSICLLVSNTRQIVPHLNRRVHESTGACHLADNGGSTKCPPLRGVLEIMQGLLDKFISGDTAKIKLVIGNTLF